MKVKELISELQKLDPEAEVVLSKDSEGNNFSPAADFSIGKYCPENTYSGEFVSEDNESDSIKAVCIWPTN